MTKTDIALHRSNENDFTVIDGIAAIDSDKFIAFFSEEKIDGEKKLMLHIALHGRSGGSAEATLEDFENFLAALNNRIAVSPFFQKVGITSYADFEQVSIGGDFNFPLTADDENEAENNRFQLQKFLVENFPDHNFAMYYPTYVRNRARSPNILDNAQFFKRGAIDENFNEVIAGCIGKKSQTKGGEIEVVTGQRLSSGKGKNLTFSFTTHEQEGISCLDHEPLFMKISEDKYLVYSNIIPCRGWAGIKKDEANLSQEERENFSNKLQQMFIEEGLFLNNALQEAGISPGRVLSFDANFTDLCAASWSVRKEQMPQIKTHVREFFRRVLTSEPYQSLVTKLFSSPQLCNKLEACNDIGMFSWQEIGPYYAENNGDETYLNNLLDRLMHNFAISTKGTSFTLNNLVNDIMGGLGTQRAGGYKLSEELAEKLMDPQISLQSIANEIEEFQEKELSRIIKQNVKKGEAITLIGIEVKHNKNFPPSDKSLSKLDKRVGLELKDAGKLIHHEKQNVKS